jgi:protein-S-isoprenylcysteine O-methyltransferase Ste14
VTRGWLGLVLETVFFALAFGWRSWVQWKRTGSTGFIRPRRGAPAVELAGASLFVAALVLLVAGPIADVSGFERIDALDNLPSAVIGAVVALGGVALTLLSQLDMGSSWRIGVDHDDQTELVTTGVFRLVRNPIFSAMVLATAGLVLLVPNALSVVAVALLVAALEIQVRFVEEPYLRSVHGAAYDQYCEKTGRFAPGLGSR